MKIREKRFGKKCLSGVFLLLAWLLITSSILAAEGPKTDQEWVAWGDKYYYSKPIQGGIFRTAAPHYIGLMNPNHWPVMDNITMGLFYEKLINHDGSFKPTVPWLAESWKYVDPVTVRMKLRRGVRFHDGSAFNAENVKYQMEWILDKKNGAWTRLWLETLKSVEVVDEYTLQWHFKRPWGAFLGTMASLPGYMISAKALKADEALSEARWLARRIGSIKRKVARAEKAAQEARAKGKEGAKEAQAYAEKARKQERNGGDECTNQRIGGPDPRDQTLGYPPRGHGPVCFRKSRP